MASAKIVSVKVPRNGRVSWDRVMERINEHPERVFRVPMGSSGSAQVTRVRVLREFANVDGWTEGSDFFIHMRG